MSSAQQTGPKRTQRSIAPGLNLTSVAWSNPNARDRDVRGWRGYVTGFIKLDKDEDELARLTVERFIVRALPLKSASAVRLERGERAATF